MATKSFSCQNHPPYKQEFINTIYHPQNYQEITLTATARLQGFPDLFVLHKNLSIAKKTTR